MRRSETIRRRREGYTLIELLVVMGIIALLAGILLQAIMKVQAVGPRVRTHAEIGELELAVESFKSTYNVKYVPSALILSNDYAQSAQNHPTWAPALQDSQQYLSKVWPKVRWSNSVMNPLSVPPNSPNPAVPANNNIEITLDGNAVLVLLLGGTGLNDGNLFLSGWNGTRTGFLNSPTNPFNMSGGVANPPPGGDKATGPFFNFKLDRIDQFSHYNDFYGHPYYYFSSKNGNDYNFFGIYMPALNQQNRPDGFNAQGGYGGDMATGTPPMNPFYDLVNGQVRYIRADTFQIVSAGKDKLPGPGGQYTAGIGGYSPGATGGDDIANFHRGMLGGDE
jgi:prepilin-type N-terminal cleavage/methylation domain-containing protein